MDNRTKNEEGFPYNLWMEIFGDMPEEPLVQDQVDGIFAALDTLTPREKDAILYCYRDGMTLEQAGRKFNITRERLRQIVAKGCRKLRHQSRRWLIEYGAEGWKAQSTYAKRKAEIDREMAEMDAEFGAFVADLQLKREKLSELERSLDAKWTAYKDAPVSYMHPGTIFQRGTVFSDSVYVIIEVTIGGFYDAECRKRYKEILKGDGDAKP